MKIIAGVIGGLIIAILGMMLVGIGAAATKDPSYGVTTFFICWIGGLILGLTSPSVGKAWRRLLLVASVFSFLLPLSGLLYTGAFMATQTKGGYEAAGAAIGGGLISGFLGFVGFFLGVVFLIIGLLVGRSPQIVYMEKKVLTEEH